MRFTFDENGNEILPPPFTVTEINYNIKSLIEEEAILQDFYIQGEISNFKKHYSTGHCYFTLKDENSEISAIMFKSYASKLAFKPENGMKVLAHARVGVYPKTGSYQLYIDLMQPDGIGSLYLAFEQLKNRLREEGLFDDEYKKPIPRFPKRIGIITSKTGAAVRDIINVATRRYPVAELVLYPTLVQGPDAPYELINGVEFFNLTDSVDVIIIGRGGGSMEDLWAFNDEGLARAIFKSKIPVISGVGHEIDYTICDFVADLRAATPSAAAELATPDILELKNQLNGFNYRAISAFLSRFNDQKGKLKELSESRVFKTPDILLDNPKTRLFTIAENLENAFRNLVSDKKMQFIGLNSKLTALNPMAVLSRGYSVIYDKEKNTVKSIDSLNVGESIEIKMCDGQIDATITSINREKQNG